MPFARARAGSGRQRDAVIPQEQDPATERSPDGLRLWRLGSQGAALLIVLLAGTALIAFLIGRNAAIAFAVGGLLASAFIERTMRSMLRSQRWELRQTLNALPVAIARCSRDLRYLLVNSACARLAGLAAHDIENRPIEQVLGNNVLEAIRPHVARVLRGETVEYAADLRYPTGERAMHIVYTPWREHDGTVSGWIATLQDVTETQRATLLLLESQRTLAAEAEALTKLSELSTRLWRTRNLTQGLDEILAAVIALLGADMGNIQLLDEHGAELAIVSQRGFRQDYLAFFARVSANDDGACSRALRYRERIIIEDVELDEAYAPMQAIARGAGYRAVTSTPLIGAGGGVLGAVSTHFRAAHRPSEQELKRLDLYLRQACDFITRCKLDQMLQQREEALREADRRKDEFLATLAHELRNPLAPIRNAAKMLQADRGQKLGWAANIIDRQTGTMARLLDDLLDVSRITRGTLTVRRERVRLRELVSGALETAQPLIEERGHRLTVAVPEALELDADPVRLEQVLSNLLTNAAKYTDRGGLIELSARIRDEHLEIDVKDSGIGLAAESLEALFSIFSQVKSTLHRSEGGVGIGLALVKGIVELHGGSVTAKSAGLGQGSEFIVRLPLSRSLLAGETAAPSPPVRVARRRVLVVDDNRDGAETLGVLLELAGHEVRVTHSGRGALDEVTNAPPEVAIIDIGMSDLNGYEVARGIRATDSGKSMLLIALTGWGQEEDKADAYAAGFDAHLTKPPDLALLQGLLAVRERKPPTAARA
jgi:PAS domain S-box-containing protein